MSPMSPTWAWPHELGQPVTWMRTGVGSTSASSSGLAKPIGILDCAGSDHELAHADAASIESTEVARNGIAIQRVPLFEHDLHSLEDIQAFAGKLCAQ